MSASRWFALVAFPALAPVLALAQAETPAEVVDRLEARLVSARHVRIEARIEASGAVQAVLEGYTELHERNRAQVRYQGTLSGKPVEISLESGSRLLEMRSGEKTRSEHPGAESNRALLLGFTRMGLLHNLARAVQLSAADHASGGVIPWLTLDSFRPTTFAQDGDLSGLASLGFDLLIDEKPTASIQLWLDAGGLPRRREQTVRFPQGEMKVVETYTRVLVE